MQLEAKNISFRYGRRQPWIVQHLDFRLEQGTCTGLSAPSGAGKSTLAMLLAGCLVPTEGRILLDGKPLPKKGVCPVQLIYQHPEQAVNPRWRLRRVLEEGGRISEGLLAGLGIEQEWLERFPRELSGGELQRFCIARALGERTRFLLADEITTMLDLITQSQIWQFLLEETRRREIGLLVVSHSRPLINRICTRKVEMEPWT